MNKQQKADMKKHMMNLKIHMKKMDKTMAEIETPAEELSKGEEKD